MEQSKEMHELLSQLQEKPPKIIGGYKKQGWAGKILEKISNDPIEKEEDGTITAKAILEAKNNTYYPSFLNIDLSQKGKVSGIYFIAENEDQFDLIPFEIGKEFLKITEDELLPLKYKTLEKIEGDEYQSNWPSFS
ncbi:hypothetical protein [Cytobacillus pseudoceanisediminis]|uniref:hypothetical protein n=1 Tax=Cytobacillus pseudoceanisediminis TaxID=3051614 RepID=UPI003C2E836A